MSWFSNRRGISETIQTLDGQKLQTVIQIIHEGVFQVLTSVANGHFSRPRSTEEIELEIELPANALTKLVIRPLKTAQPKRGRTGRGPGTGGVKRKRDGSIEAEKIRALEARIALFEKGYTGSEHRGC